MKLCGPVSELLGAQIGELIFVLFIPYKREWKKQNEKKKERMNE